VAGDTVALIGEVGGEAVWLNELSKGSFSGVWRSFTGLDAIIALGKVKGVKVLHDVSEGGVKGALMETVKSLALRLELSSKEIPLAEGVRKLEMDPLKAPTYGTVIVVYHPDAQSEVEEVARRQRKPLTVLGALKEGSGLAVDGSTVQESDRSEIDRIYGSFRVQDSVELELEEALKIFVDLPGVIRIVPEVGFNMVYAKPEARTPDEVAGLTGRIVKAGDKPVACGEVRYGGSRFVAGSVLEASRIDPAKRAGAVIKGTQEIASLLESMNLKVVKLPPESAGEACPVEVNLRSAHTVSDAYYHPGAFGIEATITVIAETPEKLLLTLSELAARV
jgi:hydroxymethylpyrimidine/phosphomethylpyrimidine kinase